MTTAPKPLKLASLKNRPASSHHEVMRAGTAAVENLSHFFAKLSSWHSPPRLDPNWLSRESDWKCWGLSQLPNCWGYRNIGQSSHATFPTASCRYRTWAESSFLRAIERRRKFGTSNLETSLPFRRRRAPPHIRLLRECRKWKKKLLFLFWHEEAISDVTNLWDLRTTFLLQRISCSIKLSIKRVFVLKQVE